MSPLVEHEGRRKRSTVDTVDLHPHVTGPEQLQHTLPFGDLQGWVDLRAQTSSERR